VGVGQKGTLTQYTKIDHKAYSPTAIHAYFTPLHTKSNNVMPLLTPPNPISAPYFSPPAQCLSIQEAYQQANPQLFDTEPMAQKLKEQSAVPYKVSWNGKIGSFETY